MPRVSREQTTLNREAIEQASSRLIRERGLGVSVADVMGAVGLTHGGFYGHFESKDQLTAIGCERAFEEARERWQRRIAEKPEGVSNLWAVVSGYLSPGKKAAPEAGCPIASLAVDVARESADKPVRAAYAGGIRKQLDILAAAQDGDPKADADRVLAQFATMVGALVLARATSGDPISEQFLAAARSSLLRKDERHARRKSKKKHDGEKPVR